MTWAACFLTAGAAVAFGLSLTLWAGFAPVAALGLLGAALTARP